MTTTGLTAAALNLLTQSGMSSTGINALKTAASSSQYFCDLLNAFASKSSSDKIQLGAAGSGAVTSTNADGTSFTISIDKNWVTGASGSYAEPWNTFASTLSHELAHAVLPGGNVRPTFNDPAGAAAAGGNNEGVALTAEYIVSKQLGMGTASTGFMHSDQGQGTEPAGFLTSAMNSDAAAAGINVMTLAVGSSSFNDVGLPAVADGASFALDHTSPSNAPNLTYRQYYSDWNIIWSCKNSADGTTISPTTVDWLHMLPTNLQYHNNVDGTCTFNGSAIPLLRSGAADGSASISGTLNGTGPMNETIALDINNDGVVDSKDTYQTFSNGSSSDDFKALNSSGAVQYEQVTTLSSTGQVTINVSGQGDVISESNVTITIADGASATIIGNNVTVNGGANDTVKFVGSGDSITASGIGDIITVGGNGANGTGSLHDVVNANNANVTITDNSSVDVNGGNSTITAGANDNVGAYGASLNVTGGAGTHVWIGNNGFNASGNLDTVGGALTAVTVVDNSTVNANVSNATVTSAGASVLFGAWGSTDTLVAQAGNTVFVGGNGQNAGDGAIDVVRGSGFTCNVYDNARVDVNDSNATVYGGKNDVLGAYGASLTLNSQAGSSLYVGGNGFNAGNLDSVFGAATTVTVVNNSTVNSNISNATISSAGASVQFGAWGSNDTLNAQAGNNVYVGGNGQNAAAGSNDVIRGNGGATYNIWDNSRADIYDHNSTIYGGANDNFGAYGAANTVRGTPTDNIWVGSNGETGALTTVSGTPNVAVTDNSHVSITGASTVLEGAFDSTAVQGTGNVSVTVNGASSSTYDFSPNVWVYDYGANDMNVPEATSDITFNYGGYDQVDNLSNYDTGYQYGQYQHGFDQFGTDSLVDSYPSDIIDSTFTSDFSAFDWGYAGAPGIVSASIANRAVPAAVSNAGGSGPPMFDRLQLAIDTQAHATVTGARFDHSAITWAFAPSQNVTDAESAAARDAFAAWAAASGLHFVQAQGNPRADITLAFSWLNTATSGVVRLTTSHNVSGFTQPGVQIQVEDPKETPFVADAAGQLVYGGTQATLVQVFEHEIGHALGLGDNADPSSIESYFLATGNRAISPSDADAVRYLYSGPGFGGPYMSQAVQDQMQVFASFAPAEGASAVHSVGVTHVGPFAHAALL